MQSSGCYGLIKFLGGEWFIKGIILNGKADGSHDDSYFKRSPGIDKGWVNDIHRFKWQSNAEGCS